MKLSRNRQGQLGVNVVERIVLHELHARWQQLDSHNDDGVDGLIFFEAEDGRTSGEILHVQVKCWNVEPDDVQVGNVNIKVGKEHLYQHAAAWQGVAGGSILIWVDPNCLNAYWVSLKSRSSFGPNFVSVPLTNPFSKASLSILRSLCGTIASDQLLKTVEVLPSDYALSFGKTPRESAREAYRSVSQVAAADTRLGLVNFGRIGWRHMTRQRRPTSRIMQSFMLIGTARRIIENVRPARRVRRWTKNGIITGEVYELSARVLFPARDPAVVRVIVVLRPELNGQSAISSFYSVYERRRRKGLLGEKLEQ